MLKLEKVFQNDDLIFLYFEIFFKSLTLYSIIYFFSVLEKNSIFELNQFTIYSSSDYYKLSIYLPILFLFSNILTLKGNKYFTIKIKKNFKDLKIFFINIFLLTIFFKLESNVLILNKKTFLLFFILIISLFFLNKIISKFYTFLIESNIIQRNILLVGKYKDIKKIYYENKNKINIYKCCIVTDVQSSKFREIRNEIKIPIFDLNQDVRSILEYHFLGQVWILDNAYDKKIIDFMIEHVIRFSVDILIIKIDKQSNKQLKYLVNNKYEYINYEISKFHGVNFLIKIILDKIFSIFFIIIFFPIILICIAIIYLEDGFPLFFVQDRTGWDGRRFKIYKLRTLKKTLFDKTKQVTKNDDRVLKIGKYIRKYSIDELPQFFNVLKGDMSIVGPRPHMVEHDIYYSKLFVNFLKRHKCNPGLTGWAQINGLRGATPNENIMKKRMDYDLWYLNNWSISLDFYIIFKTFYAVFKHKGD